MNWIDLFIGSQACRESIGCGVPIGTLAGVGLIGIIIVLFFVWKSKELKK